MSRCPLGHSPKQWYVDRRGRGRCRMCAAEYHKRKYVKAALRDPVRLAYQECARVLARSFAKHHPGCHRYCVDIGCDCGKAEADKALKRLAEVLDGK